MRSHNRTTPEVPKRLLASVTAAINGKIVTLGTCCLCGRQLSRHHLNKTGVRCYFEGAQYDQDGKLLFDARTEKLYKAAVKAEDADDCGTPLQVNKAFSNLIEAAKEVCAQQ